MSFKTWNLKDAHIQLIDGDRGKNYPKQTDFVFSDHCLFLSAKNVTTSGFEFSETIFINEERHNLLRAGTLERNDIVLTTRGTIGNVAYYDSTVDYSVIRINSGMVIVRADPNYWNARFLSYVLTSELIKKQIISLTSGSAVPQLPIRDLKRFELPKIPLFIQNQIEAVVSSITDKIHLNHQINQTLEQIAQALFKSWFVDFDPVKAKIEVLEAGGSEEEALLAAMQVISSKNAEELAAFEVEKPEEYAELRATAELFPAAMVESELGEIPEGWEASMLGEHFNVVMGQSPKGDTYNENGQGMLFFQGRRDFGFRYPEPRVYTTDPKRLAQSGDTLISVRAPVGDRNMAAQECCLGRGVAGIRHKSGARGFTYAFIGHIEKRLGDSGSEGTVFSSINKKELENVDFIAPSKMLVKLFECYVDPIDQKIELLTKEIKNLETLRDSLLPKLLSGELLVQETTIKELN